MYFIIFLTILTCICLIFIKRKRNILNQFQEPPSIFFFGHLWDIRTTKDIINVCAKYTSIYGKTVKLRPGPFTALLTIDDKFVEFILKNNKSLRKSINYLFLKPWLGSGLLISEGAKWKKHRKIITPTFHFEILKQFIEIFESAGNVLIEKLTKYHDVPNVDLYPFVTLYTLDVICETAMGTKINAQNGENSDYVRSVKEMCRIVTDRCLSFLKLFDATFILTKDYYLQKKHLKILHNFTMSIINKKNEAMKYENETNNKIEKKKNVFLDLLLELSNEGKLLSYEEIREEVDTFMFEGHDTTASGISFTLFCLANYPDVQDRVLEEQKQLFGNEKNPSITYQDLQNMKYLELVIKEAFRLYPPVPVIGRHTNEAFEYDGSIIPKDIEIVIFVYGMHRNPEFFPEPEKFNPDRFNDFSSSHPFAFIPFSAGSRNCIGQKFAMLELKSAVSKIIRHFELIPANPQHDPILLGESVLKSENGIKVGLKRRI